MAAPLDGKMLVLMNVPRILVVRPKSDTLFSRKVSHLGQCLNTHGVWPSGTEAEGSPLFWPKGGHGVKVLATRFPPGATILTFGGIASFLAFPVFLRAKRMD